MAQIKNQITGKVVDSQNKPLELVNIKVIETNQYATTDKSGVFRINGSEINNVLTLEFSYIGFQKLRIPVTVKSGETNLGNISLKILDLSLENIEINAKRNYSGSTNSSLIITRDLIEQTPALSVNDLLNQIPNRKITPPSLQNIQNLTLRSAFELTTNGRDPFTLNNSFGVAIIVDGNNISNNANMQGYNPGLRGLGSTSISSNDFGLTGTTSTSSYSGDFAYGGTDLRQISADNIESIEVIAGVPSVKYSDLSDGAVIIERQAGKSPAYVRMQVRDNATSYSFSRGFMLSPQLGSFNVGVNYVNSYADNRDKIKAYKRINTNAMWTNSFGKDKRIKNTLSFDYSRNLDGIKKDDDDPTSRIVSFHSWNMGVSNRTSYRLNTDFLKNIGLNLRYGASHQRSYTEQFVNSPYILYNNATETGLVNGIYDKGIYTAISDVDGRPITASAQLDLNAEYKTGNLNHFLNFGANFSYAANNGLGRLSDPARSRPGYNTTGNSLSAGPSERYYDFSLAYAQKDFGLYAEDVFTLKVSGRDLNFRGGLRLDGQNGFVTLSPRTNINYQLTKNFRLGFAYGLSVKSPGLAQRYPGPTFVDVPLINAYNGNANESASIYYVRRYDPDGSKLKSSKGQTFELSGLYKIKDYQLSFSLFHKLNTQGYNTVKQFEILTLPQYAAVFTPGSKPSITENGTKRFLVNHNEFNNDLKANNQGFDVILSTPKYEVISTSFNISGGIYRSSYQETSDRFETTISDNNTIPDYPITGVYAPRKKTTYFSSGRVTSSTHIPAISLIVQLTAEFSFLNKTLTNVNDGVPKAYFTRDVRYIEITNPDPNNKVYGHLFIPENELTSDNQYKIYSNYHLSLAKEIKKRFKFAFNAYNFLNYQPTYKKPNSNTLVFPNGAPTFGIELSLKL
ncbi:TonB-dependent receptor [Pedobacter punctiformis]|uniref:TonB-dependent receptor n=1 Tax=Pedobacter punctiformis TaxID=3004097 RepID=A0ABT4LCP1_9SPHI|nr:TonB-dependent receptor [Pedobacter sp. HCMS5-2]MCZ4245675.1 TonB-dependent receptor [Pedobacter sp. HCMS5-2]